jgi:hypothetical protein
MFPIVFDMSALMQVKTVDNNTFFYYQRLTFR